MSQPSQATINSLAAATEGFAGADLQALCASAVLAAVRRTHARTVGEVAEVASGGSLPARLASLKVPPLFWPRQYMALYSQVPMSLSKKSAKQGQTFQMQVYQGDRTVFLWDSALAVSEALFQRLAWQRSGMQA